LAFVPLVFQDISTVGNTLDWVDGYKVRKVMKLVKDDVRQLGTEIATLRPKRLYEGMNITGAIGLSAAQKPR
jgi:hypothetical protein